MGDELSTRTVKQQEQADDENLLDRDKAGYKFCGKRTTIEGIS
jgi:hypothetical protein